jgi:hypothetical protein
MRSPLTLFAAATTLFAAACGGQVSIGTLNGDAGTEVTQVQSPVVCPSESTLVRTVFDRKATAGGQSEIVDFASDGVSLYVAAPVTANFQAGAIWKVTGNTTTKLIDTSPRDVQSIALTRTQLLFVETSGSPDELVKLRAIPTIGGTTGVVSLRQIYGHALYGGSENSRAVFAELEFNETNAAKVSRYPGPNAPQASDYLLTVNLPNQRVDQVLLGGDKALIVVVDQQANLNGENFQLLREAPSSTSGFENVGRGRKASSEFVANSTRAYVVASVGGDADNPIQFGNLYEYNIVDASLKSEARRRFVTSFAADNEAYEDNERFHHLQMDDQYIYVEHTRVNTTSTVITRVSRTQPKSLSEKARVENVKTITGRSVSLPGDVPKRSFTTDACNLYWTDGDKIYSQSKASLAPN